MSPETLTPGASEKIIRPGSALSRDRMWNPHIDQNGAEVGYDDPEGVFHSLMPGEHFVAERNFDDSTYRIIIRSAKGERVLEEGRLGNQTTIEQRGEKTVIARPAAELHPPKEGGAEKDEVVVTSDGTYKHREQIERTIKELTEQLKQNSLFVFTTRLTLDAWNRGAAIENDKIHRGGFVSGFDSIIVGEKQPSNGRYENDPMTIQEYTGRVPNSPLVAPDIGEIVKEKKPKMCLTFRIVPITRPETRQVKRMERTTEARRFFGIPLGQKEVIQEVEREEPTGKQVPVLMHERVTGGDNKPAYAISFMRKMYHGGRPGDCIITLVAPRPIAGTVSEFLRGHSTKEADELFQALLPGWIGDETEFADLEYSGGFVPDDRGGSSLIQLPQH